LSDVRDGFGMSLLEDFGIGVLGLDFLERLFMLVLDSSRLLDKESGLRMGMQPILKVQIIN
jgi:hypothetical protein